MQILELTFCSHPGLFVDSHPKFICQNTINQLVAYLAALSTDRRRIGHQSHTMSSERRPNQCKYWNLHAVVMSECSLIATRNSHAKHNKSVHRIPRGAEVRETEMGWCTHVSVAKKDIVFLIFSPSEAQNVPTQRTRKSNPNQRVSIKKTKNRTSPR